MRYPSAAVNQVETPTRWHLIYDAANAYVGAWRHVDEAQEHLPVGGRIVETVGSIRGFTDDPAALTAR